MCTRQTLKRWMSEKQLNCFLIQLLWRSLSTTEKLFKGIYCRNYVSFVILIMIFLWLYSTHNFAKLMNDVFDSLNGRYYKQGITLENMEERFTPLKAMLKVLDIKDQLHKTREENSSQLIEMFVSTTTLRGVRIVIHSAMLLTKEMLDNGYS